MFYQSHVLPVTCFTSHEFCIYVAVDSVQVFVRVANFDFEKKNDKIVNFYLLLVEQLVLPLVVLPLVEQLVPLLFLVPLLVEQLLFLVGNPRSKRTYCQSGTSKASGGG